MAISSSPCCARIHRRAATRSRTRSGTSIAAPNVTRVCAFIIATIYEMRENVARFGQLAELFRDRAGLLALAETLKSRGIPFDIHHTPRMIKAMLTEMAVPLPDCTQHEVGAGLVDELAAITYFAKSFRPSTFLRYFAPLDLAPSIGAALDEQFCGPLVSDVGLAGFFGAYAKTIQYNSWSVLGLDPKPASSSPSLEV